MGVFVPGDFLDACILKVSSSEQGIHEGYDLGCHGFLPGMVVGSKRMNSKNYKRHVLVNSNRGEVDSNPVEAS